VTAVSEVLPPAATPAPLPSLPPARRGPALRRRLGVPAHGTPYDRLLGWLVPIALTLLALAQRLHNISNPRCLMFDETYYPSDGESLWLHGIEGNFRRAVTTCEGVASTNSSYGYPAHPPLGKYVIGLGEKAFGFTPLGWRFSDAVMGSLVILLTARIGRRLTRSTLLGCLAALLLALDGLELVFSRSGLLDIGLLFWLMSAVACLLADRDWTRARIAARVDAGAAVSWPGPALGIHWWRMGAGVCLGAMLATKWSGLPYIVLAAVLSLVWDAGARRVAGVRAPVRAAVWKEGRQVVVAFIAIPTLIYVASFGGYFFTNTGWDRNWHQTENARNPNAVADLRSWFHFQTRDVLCFHENLQNEPHTESARCGGGHDNASHHPYESKPFGWLLLAKPVLFAYDGLKEGQRPADNPVSGQVCHADGEPSGCSRAVLATGTPALWLAGLISVFGCLIVFAAKRDWRAGFLGAMFLAGFVPWLSNTERVMFLFYALPLIPVYALSIALLVGYAFGGPRASPRRQLIAASGTALLVLFVAVDFWWLLPVLTGDVIPYSAWNARVIGTWGFPGWL
jgi:dolichyl-phosphate-mannose--protein O-mannosyl transferase